MSPTSQPVAARSIPTLSRRPQPSPTRPVPDPFQPSPDPSTSPSPAPDPVRAASPPPTPAPEASDASRPEPPQPPDPDAPRTTSSAGERTRSTVSPADVAVTLGKLLLVLAFGAGWLASKRGWELTPPDDDQVADVADPVARILVRHVGTRFLTDDLVDGVQAAAGVTSYVTSSPLHRRGPEPTGVNDGQLPEGYEEI